MHHDNFVSRCASPGRTAALGLAVVGWCLLLTILPCLPAHAAEGDLKAGRYAVVARAETLKEAGWKAVTDALQTRHAATLVTYKVDVREALLELAARCPDYVAFVAPPTEAKPAFVWAVHRMMRELDEERHQQIITIVNRAGQSILTTTDWADYPVNFRDRATLFSVVMGRLEETTET